MATSRALTEAEIRELQAGLADAGTILKAEPPLSLDQVQSLYDTFLEQRIDDPKLIVALGLSFGQCIVESGPFEWIRVIDEEYGDETSVAVIDAAIYLHPINMLQKRLEDGEPVVIEQLMNDSLAQIAALVNRREFRAR